MSLAFSYRSKKDFLGSLNELLQKKIQQEGQEQGENTYTWPILPQPESYDRDIALLMSQHV